MNSRFVVFVFLAILLGAGPAHADTLGAADVMLMHGKDDALPDEGKRAGAQRDLVVLRARILRELKTDAEEDGIPWPPGKEDGNDR